jgi:hypothetical protein
MKTLFALTLALASMTAACAAEDPSCLTARCTGRGAGNGNGADPDTPDTPSAQDAGPLGPDGGPVVIPTGRSYTGFGGADLTASRQQEPRGDNRGRVKPFSVLGAEYARVLGETPASLASQADTFKAAPARWFEEPEMTGVTLFSSYNMAYEACMAYVGKNAARFAADPVQASADQECRAMQRAFWSREPHPAEVTACTTFALTKSQEPQGTAQKRWAHTCASVMSAAPFLTY